MRVEEAGTAPGPSRLAPGRLNIAIVGGSLRAASILRLFSEVENLAVVAVADASVSSPVMRLAGELGVFATTDPTELFQVPNLDIMIDVSEDPALGEALATQKPSGVELIGTSGSELIWDLLVAKKRGEEQEKLFVELQVAYDKIRSHERRLQAGKESLERANEELEGKLAEIFFTHEFFKALTSFSLVADVASLIVDGANGILGAEISCVYLLRAEDWTLRLAASQGRADDAFAPTVDVSQTILGRAFSEGAVQEPVVAAGDPSAAWFVAGDELESQAAVPLRSGDTIIGVLVVASSVDRELTPAEFDRLGVIANQSSLALQNALLHEELERLSVTDRLTELYNHGYLQQRLEEELARAVRFGHELSLLLLDIDDFKDFNDRFLHQRGDTVLRAVSQMIRQNLRDIDVAARYGGEEFVVVLPETDVEGAVAVAERIRESVASYPFVGREDLPPVAKTVSVGVATFPTHASTQGKLIDAADRAMYAAKRAGKDRVAVASAL
ncbi:MAG: GGDEF domain-containing protein [Actinobacteria bacterium]|nr:MAG: GGDEF domain-containing protein [Actinomycetota bacterium]